LEEENMSTNPYVVAAHSLADEISASAREGEELRRMPDDLVSRLLTAGLFHLGVPAALGGAECEPSTIIDVVEEVSRADGSAGWNVFVGQATMFIAWLDPAVAKQMAAENPGFLVSSAFPPMGTARPDGDGLVIDGRWSFCSGCSHADWFMQGVMMMEGDAPRVVPPGRPDWRFAFIPAKEAEIIDTWHVAGLRGSGSHDIAAAGARVSYGHTIMPFYEPAQFDGPLYRLPFPTVLCATISGFPLGVARRALDEFIALAHSKSHAPPSPPMAEDGHVQLEVARAEASLRAARAYVDDAIGDAWETVHRGSDVTIDQRANAVMATLHAARTARSVVGHVYALAGGGAIYDRNPLQRCARDIEAGTQHIFLGFGQWRTTGRVLFGLEPDTPRV
jgi:alkylation response protein AidB-like acyl-CoA dehydrogenase